ncbi:MULTISPECIES: hypothetical protein [Streptomyces]|uniref:AG1 protein n=1 Tax=Streptomyces camelliae TaxID=3004093 RepID=A0ABY7NYZ9_9ACTN|nr:hypothetical protein [Streptomyces sp. HUAS 2-6]WBO63473.1 hypothetical protein O1G22_11870 [Streptomyces sp. HUAS 2-6]
MAWDEWEQLKTQAAERHSAKMGLDHVVADPGGGSGDGGQQGDLRVSQQDLAAVGKAAYQLHQDFSQCSDQARLPSMKAAGDLEDQGFALGAALDHVAEHWVDQVQSLLDATAHISNHLDYTKGVHARDDAYIAGTISSISTLDAGFDQRTGQG